MEEVSKTIKPQTNSVDFRFRRNFHGIQRQSRFFHPYLQLSISIALTAAAQMFLKIGVDM